MFPQLSYSRKVRVSAGLSYIRSIYSLDSLIDLCCIHSSRRGHKALCLRWARIGRVRSKTCIHLTSYASLDTMTPLDPNPQIFQIFEWLWLQNSIPFSIATATSLVSAGFLTSRWTENFERVGEEGNVESYHTIFGKFLYLGIIVVILKGVNKTSSLLRKIRTELKVKVSPQFMCPKTSWRFVWKSTGFFNLSITTRTWGKAFAETHKLSRRVAYGAPFCSKDGREVQEERFILTQIAISISTDSPISLGKWTSFLIGVHLATSRSYQMVALTSLPAI